jgi:glucose-1-phosphate adenylyltransferase
MQYSLIKYLKPHQLPSKMTEYIDTGQVLTMVLAGGEGSRLAPLTNHRAKPGVPIYGDKRIIDFVLTNMVRSGMRNIHVLTQYKYDSLKNHIHARWGSMNNQLMNEYIEVVSTQMRMNRRFSEGTAESVYENQNLIHDQKPKHVAIFSGDHIYYMDIRDMLREHIENDADVTISVRPMKKSDIPRETNGKLSFGIVQTVNKPGLEGKVSSFLEKPSAEGLGEELLISQGNYIFKPGPLTQYINRDLKDFGKNVLPQMLKDGLNVRVYDFSKNRIPGMTDEKEFNFWMDLGTVDSYFEANMEAVEINPRINLYNYQWALMRGPTKTVFSGSMEGRFDNYRSFQESERLGATFSSLISQGCIISGAVTFHSILSENVKMHSYSKAVNSILFESVDLGRHSEIRNTIVDKYVHIPEWTRIGYDAEEDKARGITISPGGIRIVWKGYDFKFPRGYDPAIFRESEDFEITGKLIPLRTGYNE